MKEYEKAATAGMAAAVVWAVSEPILCRLFRSQHSDIRLLGALFTRTRLWLPLGLCLHLANGAVFGMIFCALGFRGWKMGVAAAELENIALWPGLAIVDRVHPDYRSGARPRTFSDGRTFAHEVAAHALFGAVLGCLLAEED